MMGALFIGACLILIYSTMPPRTTYSHRGVPAACLVEHLRVDPYRGVLLPVVFCFSAATPVAALLTPVVLR